MIQTPLTGLQTPLTGLQTPLDGLQTPPACPPSLLACKPLIGLRTPLTGRLLVKTYGRMDGKYPYSKGLRPLPGLLPYLH